MVVDIDVKQLGVLTEKLKSLIDECEEAELNIFHQLKDSCNNWQDGNSVEFEKQSEIEKTESQVFLGAIQGNQAALANAYAEYKTIGDKIYICLGKKNAIMKAIDNCIAKADSAINNFSNIERGFYYYEASLINNKRDETKKVKEELQAFKSAVSELYIKIEAIEERIAARAAKIEAIKGLSKFSFVFKTSGTTIENTMNEELFEQNIDVLDMYNGEEKAKMISIFEYFDNCFSACKTDSIAKVINGVNFLRKELPTLYSNRDEYKSTLETAIRKYKETAEGTVASAKGGSN